MGMLSSVRFTCTALKNSGKKGLLTKDSEGYYESVLGGLNVFNSAGEFYTAEGAKQLFENSGLLQKRIKQGRLRGEWGHPKQHPGESDSSFINRIFLINEEKVACHFKEIWLDDTNVKNDAGQPVIAIMGKFCPSGPYADSVERTLSNPNENISFSIRAFTDDQRIRGVNNRCLKTIVTWDIVNCPGISIAEKWKSPSLEDMKVDDVFERTLSRGEIERSIKSTTMAGLAQESAVMNAQELFTSLGWVDTNKAQPAFMKW
jgi:hypothetical protein